jgi:hypothetical protein
MPDGASAPGHGVCDSQGGGGVGEGCVGDRGAGWEGCGGGGEDHGGGLGAGCSVAAGMMCADLGRDWEYGEAGDISVESGG